MFELSKNVGSVFQNPRTQFFNVDTNSEIVFALENQGVEREILEKKLDETCNKLEINKLKNRNIFHLSGGEKQKIAFASVYATNPDIYLLDEPSSNLDIPTIDILKKHLSMLKESGKTVIISEHRIYYIMDLVDRIIYMKNGKIDKIFSNKDFLSLSEDEIKTMGLRTRNKPSLNIKEKSPIIDKSYLQVNNVSIYRKDKCLIDRLNFCANKGDIIAVLGSNGIGKTTFLRTLCGLYTDYKGEFILKSKKIDEKARKQISYMVMQDVNYQLFAESVFAECKLGIKNVKDDLINELLNDFDLYNYKNSHPNTLSGGQKQRLAIVCGLLCNKEIFILDEPTSGLDYKNMLKTVELLKSHSKDKIIFIATHDFEFASLICNRVLDLEKKQDIRVI
ncbi:ABC transporter ATP-binding protein [Fenollaria massiliensis]|uniref:ABC transporter ATP-binding protein n=1 Tax=Fenollaria massiliensis TaxID=938288 RepID=UPI00241886D1|nr:ABC transporter ATP-binding protein [Fenollaria massiliensis]